jgi:hypothetical protein
MKKSILFLTHLSVVVVLTGVFSVSAYSQGRTGGGGGSGNTGSGGFNTGSGGFNTSGMGGIGGSNTGSSGSSSLFNSGSSSSLFNSGSSSSGSNSGSNTSGSGAGAGSGLSETSISTGQIGSATPIQRGEVINRGGRGANLINSNYDIIGGQSTSGGNQFANLFSQIGRQMNQGGNFNQQGGRNTVRPAIRIPLKLGFTPKPVSAPLFTAKFESRIAKLSAITSIGPIRVTMDGSTAILQGVVATGEDRQLAEGVALLEPEVESVRNELTVQGEEPGSAERSPPAATTP